jgi:hypothetical protein
MSVIRMPILILLKHRKGGLASSTPQWHPNEPTTAFPATLRAPRHRPQPAKYGWFWDYRVGVAQFGRKKSGLARQQQAGR